MTPLGRGQRPIGGDGRPVEALQELRVVGAGALVLLLFLVCVSFTSRFTWLSVVQYGRYITSMVLAAVAAVLLLIPVAYLHLRRGHRTVEQMSRALSGIADCGLAAAGLAMAAAVRLAARWAGPTVAADFLGAGTAVVFAVAWFILPRPVKRDSWQDRGSPPAGGPADARRNGG